jgi:hypothetical protein
MSTRIAIAALLLAACSKTTPEPERSKDREAPVSSAPKLSWQAPASWQLEKAAGSGHYRAKYTIPAQGDAPHPAELLITSHGTGPAEELEKPLAELKRDFEGPSAANASTSTRTHRGFEIHELEVAGTYKFPMGPKVGKRPAAQVMKENWRALGASVRAPNGELWFFRLVGPEDTVQAARSAFRSMLDQLEVK